jgi:putative ABC transport system permease protein
VKLLRILSSFLPAEFRHEYGGELLDTALERWREVESSLGPVGRARFWAREWVALLRLAADLRWGTVAGVAVAADGEAEMDGVWRDVRHAARSLLARPGFTLVAVLTLGLGVGATTAMFSAVNSVLLRALPYRGVDEVFVVKQTNTRDGSTRQGVSAANMRDVAAATRTLSHASASHAYGFTLLEKGTAHSVRGWLVSQGFFEAIGGQARLGRTFAPEEFLAGREKAVVLGHASWQTRFGGDPHIVGRSLVLDGAVHTVVGVLPPDFKYPGASEVWAPRPPKPWDEGVRAGAGLQGVVRLAPGATAAQAQAELDQIAERLAEVYPRTNTATGFRLVPLRQQLFGEVRTPLMLLLGAVALVLLIAAANVAGLQLARGAGRLREYAVRGALGASSLRILRLVLVESLLLAGAGGLLGVALAALGVRLILLLGPDHLPRIDELRIDGTVLAFALMAAGASALMAGIIPALRASSVNPQAALNEKARGSTRGPRGRALGDRLVVVEIALALVLTIGAGLLIQSFDRLMDNELGFDPRGRLAVQVFAYDEQDRPNLAFVRRGMDAIRAIPGVQAVGVTTVLPLADNQLFAAAGGATRFTIDGRAVAEGEEPAGWSIALDGDYAPSMGIAVRSGRTFGAYDHAQAPAVAMVNEAFVRRHFPNQDPLGARITITREGAAPREIVGVLADVRAQGFESEPRPEMYVPLPQAPAGGVTFVIRSATDTPPLTSAVHAALWSANANQAIWASSPMTDLLWDWTRQRQFNTSLLVAFAALALSLAAIGVYGLMSFSVEQRINELGIRRALGGQTGHILWMVLKRALTLALAGVGFGLIGSLALTRALQGMLFDIGRFDALTFVTLSALVIGVALFAALWPALRATRVHPLIAMRTD